MSMIEESLITHRCEGQRKDSIEIGTAGRGGCLKIYFDSDEPMESITARMDSAKAALDHARALMGAGQ
jgi:hypothetical protein